MISDLLDLSGKIDFLLRNYLQAGNYNRFFNDYSYLTDEPDFDLDQAGAQLLGIDMYHLMEERSRKHIQNILDTETREQNEYRLVSNMTVAEYRDKFEENLALLTAVKRGFVE